MSIMFLWNMLTSFSLRSALEERPISEKTSETLQVTNSSMDYADNMTRDLQSFAEKREPIFRKTDINVMVKDVLADLKTSENVEKNIKLNKLPKIEANKDMTKLVFVNLAVNGMQTTKKRVKSDGCKGSIFTVVLPIDRGMEV